MLAFGAVSWSLMEALAAALRNNMFAWLLVWFLEPSAPPAGAGGTIVAVFLWTNLAINGLINQQELGCGQRFLSSVCAG